MLINAHDMKGAAIIARDGAIGEVEDVYFDDEKWTARYLVVKAGALLSRRDVLISPISIEKVDGANNQVIVTLTRDQVKNSPDIDTHKPVSRQHETAFMDYYGYPYYWGGPYLWGDSEFPATLAMPPAVESQIAAAAARRRESDDSYDEHLRSVNEVRGYHIEAADGTKYSPTNLPPEFQKDGTAVEAEMLVRKDMMGVNQVGPIVDIVRIRATS